MLFVFAVLVTFIDKHLINRKTNYNMPLKGIAYLLVLHLAPFFTQASKSDAAFLTLLSAGGAALGTVLCFHLSHINEPNSEHAHTFRAGDDWGAHQLRVSANFKGTMYALGSLTGMLDMQIEHHLFPSLSYRNQQRIKPIVEATAKDFGLPYYEFDSVAHGIAGHLYTMHLNGIPALTPAPDVKKQD